MRKENEGMTKGGTNCSTSYVWNLYAVFCRFYPILRVYMILGDTAKNLETFVWTLNHV